MTTVVWHLLPVLAIVAGAGRLPAQPLAGSQLPLRENACARCHAQQDAWDQARQRLFVSEESLAEDVHQQAGVNCHDCHGGDPSSSEVPEAHAAWNGFRGLQEVETACGKCHPDPWVGVKRKGVHFRAGKKDETGRAAPIRCGACHGAKVHGMLPIDDSRSPVFLDHQVGTCGGCHQEERETYQRSTHGHGLTASGLLVTAVCADCHDAHGIYRAADRRSTLHASRVADTCGKCHGFIEDRLRRSVHGRGGLGGVADRTTPGGTGKREPSCTDCHQGHDLPHPESREFRLELPHRCGNCHTGVFGQYAISLHGELTELGYGPAAKCSDCHGAHDVLPPGDRNSHLAPGNRLATCRKCHLYAVANFCDFDPHADHKDHVNYPGLYAVYHWTKDPLDLAFGLFLLHAILWFLRSFVRTLRRGRHRVLTTGEQVAFLRFGTIRRTVYAIMLICFLGLTMTGLPLKFGDQAWARSFAQSLGGFETTSVWHRSFAVLALFGCVLHLTWGAGRILELRESRTPWKSILFGPDSPLPGVRDAKDLLGMVRWFFGLGRKPTFERWTYWEKLDYWAVWLAIGLIATSGLMLWYPNVFCTVLPGGTLNVAKLLHGELALYIACCLFVIHLFNTHLRPEKFPMDPSVITGLVSEEHLRSARPEYLARMERAGLLEHVQRRVPPRRRVRVIKLAAFLLFTVGLALLALVLFANLGG